MTHDIVSLKKKILRLRARLLKSHSTLLGMAESSTDGMVILDKEKRVVYSNYAAIRLFERSFADLLEIPIHMSIGADNLFSREHWVTEIKVPKKSGTASIVETFLFRAEWNNQPGYVVKFCDITEHKKTEALLENLSHHDALTGLPNRTLFVKSLETALKLTKEFQQSYVAVLYLDLDNFKMVNDTLGHPMGDALLKMVAAALMKSVRKTDVIARLSGDEFAILLPMVRKPEYAAVVARHILEKLNTAFQVEGKEIFTNVSIGIAIAPFAGTTATDLIKNADSAMYAAKNNGKNQYWFFSDELREHNQQHADIINGLRLAIRNKEFLLHYQPIVALASGQCVGVEALLRWQHPTLGLLSPDAFLSDATEMRLIPTIGKQVIESALDHLVKCRRVIPGLFMSINVSIQELDEGPSAENYILAQMKMHSLPETAVVLELTESSIMSNPQQVVKILNRLSSIGVKIAIDDYGTGYSSLSYFKRLPVSILKIDKSFVADLGKNLHQENDNIIVTSTIQLAHSLGLKVIAEGVETERQLTFLKEADCDYVQGFYFARPMTAEKVVEFLQNRTGSV